MMKTSRTPVSCSFFSVGKPGSTSCRRKRKISVDIATTEIELAARDEAARLRKETIATAARTSVKLTAMQTMAEMCKSLTRAASKAEEKVKELTEDLKAATASIKKAKSVWRCCMKKYDNYICSRRGTGDTIEKDVVSACVARRAAEKAVEAASYEVDDATRTATNLREEAAATAKKRDMAAADFYDEDQRLQAIGRNAREAEKHALKVAEAVSMGIHFLSRADSVGEGGGFADLLAAGGVVDMIDSANLPERTGARKRARR